MGVYFSPFIRDIAIAVGDELIGLPQELAVPSSGSNSPATLTLPNDATGAVINARGDINWGLGSTRPLEVAEGKYIVLKDSAEVSGFSALSKEAAATSIYIQFYKSSVITQSFVVFQGDTVTFNDDPVIDGRI